MVVPVWLPFEDEPAAAPGPRMRSPICFYAAPCPRAGVAELGPEEVLDGCINRAIRCLTCGRTGIESINTEPRKPGRFLKLDRTGEIVCLCGDVFASPLEFREHLAMVHDKDDQS